jgi:hypothetical protein
MFGYIYGTVVWRHGCRMYCTVLYCSIHTTIHCTLYRTVKNDCPSKQDQVSTLSASFVGWLERDAKPSQAHTRREDYRPSCSRAPPPKQHTVRMATPSFQQIIIMMMESGAAIHKKLGNLVHWEQIIGELTNELTHFLTSLLTYLLANKEYSFRRSQN